MQASVTSCCLLNRLSWAMGSSGSKGRHRPEPIPQPIAETAHGARVSAASRRNLTQLDGEELARVLAGCRIGNEASWRQLVEGYKDWVYRLAYGFVHDPHDAEDLAQDVFVEVHRWLPSYRGEARFPTWLYRVATNVCLRAIRARGKEAPVAIEDLERRLVDVAPDGPEEAAMESEARRHVHRMVAELPEHYRAVVVLCDLQELPYEEAAQALRISVGTVRSRVHRGRNLLRQKLQDYFRETGR